jgi:hypothetical protein
MSFVFSILIKKCKQTIVKSLYSHLKKKISFLKLLFAGPWHRQQPFLTVLNTYSDR